MLKKYVPRLLVIILFWGFFYNAISLAIINKSVNVTMIWIAVKMVLTADTLYGYQFWYLYMLIGMYLFIPLLKPWVDQYMNDIRPNLECKIAFCIFGLLGIVVPAIMRIIGYTDSIWQGGFVMFSGNMFYILCGKWLIQWGLDKKLRIVFASIVAVHLILFAYLIWSEKNENIDRLYGGISLFTFSLTVLLFYILRNANLTKLPRWIRATMRGLSSCSLGVYIFHVMILQMLRKAGIDFYVMNPWLAPIAEVSVVIIISVGLTIIFKKIGLKRLVG